MSFVESEALSFAGTSYIAISSFAKASFFFAFVSVGMSFASPPGIQNLEERRSDEVEVGKLFSIERKINLPEEAYPAFRIYMNSLLFSRPLPWPLYIDSFDVQKGVLRIQGRLLRPGVYDIPLGVFWWKGVSYLLPTVSYTSLSISPFLLTAENLLLPFPKKALGLTAGNKQLRDEILSDNQRRGLTELRWQERWCHILAFASLFLVCIPLAFQYWRWFRVRRKPEVFLQIVTPGMAFHEVKALQQRGETPWPKLLHVLNLVASEAMPSLTSYELGEHFTAQGEKGLAEASRLIETFGYRSDNGQYFQEAVQRVEQELSVKKLV
jgi:hypothetical protein